ncbi:Retrotransposon gag protein [Arachis hypogaea]|nr:Retrotransposon gag protein [Arachis hypogaea]
MADKSIQQALGIVENVLVKVDKFFLPADFVILDIEEDDKTPINLGSPFLATSRTLIDVEKEELMMRVHEEHIVFHVFKNLQDSTQEEECMKMDSINPNLKEAPNETHPMHLNSC